MLAGIFEGTMPIDGLLLVGGVQSFAKSFNVAYFENYVVDSKQFAAADDCKPSPLPALADGS